MTSIYCDESGQTGNRLTDQNSNQLFFVYSGVAIEEDAAQAVVTKVRDDFKLQGKELKVTNLSKHPAGQRALSYVLDTCAHNACVVYSNKKYALACKFFEQMIEPIINEHKSFFYRNGFHKYVAHLLFYSFEAQEEVSELLLTGLQNLFMSRNKTEALGKFIQQIYQTSPKNVELRQIRQIITDNVGRIQEDITVLENEPFGKWILDLTMSSLFSVLCNFSERCDALEVYVDSSKPLKDNQETVDLLPAMFPGLQHDIQKLAPSKAAKFNATKVHTLQSDQSAGIQIAEVFAGTMAYVLNHPKTEISKEWSRILQPAISANGIVEPETNLLEKNLLNSAMLSELSVRTASKTRSLLSFEEATFTRYRNMKNMAARAGSMRNSLCACGSNAKFKDCHGK